MFESVDWLSLNSCCQMLVFHFPQSLTFFFVGAWWIFHFCFSSPLLLLWCWVSGRLALLLLARYGVLLPVWDGALLLGRHGGLLLSRHGACHPKYQILLCVRSQCQIPLLTSLEVFPIVMLPVNDDVTAPPWYLTIFMCLQILSRWKTHPWPCGISSQEVSLLEKAPQVES